MQPSVDATDRLLLGHAVVESSRNRITAGSDSVRVAKRDMDVLRHLMESGTSVVSRQQLIETVWSDTVVNDEVLTLAISRIRRALRDDSRSPKIIETIPKRGYRLMVTPQPQEADLGVSSRTTRIPPLLRSSRFWVAALVVLLLIMTYLFAVVRKEYGRTSVNSDLVIQSEDDRQQ